MVLVHVEEYIDVSDYTQPLTPIQQEYCRYNLKGITIGLQDASRAREQQAMAIELDLPRAYYVDKRGRDLSIPDPGSFCAIDVEAGCFTELGDVEAETAQELAAGLQILIYGNFESMRNVAGANALSRWPLWWANYGINNPLDFDPFLGFTRPMILQYSSGGIMGINCDRNLLCYYDDGGPIWTPPRVAVL